MAYFGLWNQCLYQLYSKTGGTFFGCSYQDRLPCSLYQPGDYPLLYTFRVDYRAQYGANGRGCVSTVLPLEDELRLVGKKAGLIKLPQEWMDQLDWDELSTVTFDDPELNKRYSVRSNRPDFVRLAFADNRLTQQWDSKKCRLSCFPQSEEGGQHLLEIELTKSFQDDLLFGKAPDVNDLAEMGELCRTAAYCLRQFRMEGL